MWCELFLVVCRSKSFKSFIVIRTLWQCRGILQAMYSNFLLDCPILVIMHVRYDLQADYSCRNLQQEFVLQCLLVYGSVSVTDMVTAHPIVGSTPCESLVHMCLCYGAV